MRPLPQISSVYSLIANRISVVATGTEQITHMKGRGCNCVRMTGAGFNGELKYETLATACEDKVVFCVYVPPGNI